MAKAEILHYSQAGLGSDTKEWKCRICGFERYFRVVVPRGNNKYYTTQFFACSKCQVMFLNPVNFNAHNVEPVVDVKPAQEFRIPVRK